MRARGEGRGRRPSRCRAPPRAGRDALAWQAARQVVEQDWWAMRAWPDRIGEAAILPAIALRSSDDCVRACFLPRAPRGSGRAQRGRRGAGAAPLRGNPPAHPYGIGRKPKAPTARPRPRRARWRAAVLLPVRAVEPSPSAHPDRNRGQHALKGLAVIVASWSPSLRSVQSLRFGEPFATCPCEPASSGSGFLEPVLADRFPSACSSETGSEKPALPSHPLRRSPDTEVRFGRCR